MDQPHSNWRAMFENKRKEHPPSHGHGSPPPAEPRGPFGGYDDGYHATQGGGAPASPEEITDAAAMALASDPQEYRPWILQRGRSRPVPNLHLRRFDQRSGQWQGWIVPYPFVAVEYCSDSMFSLDFGTRHFVVEGRRLSDEIVAHLHDGTVLCLQEHSPAIWPKAPTGAMVSRIRVLTADNG